MKSNARRQKIRRFIAFFKGLRNVAEDITSVGSFERGGGYAIKKYNLVLDKLRHELPDLELDLFEPLSADSVGPEEEEQHLAEMGVAATMLIKYLSLELEGFDEDDDDYGVYHEDEDEEDWDEEDEDEFEEDSDDEEDDRDEDEEDEENYSDDEN